MPTKKTEMHAEVRLCFVERPHGVALVGDNLIVRSPRRLMTTKRAVTIASTDTENAPISAGPYVKIFVSVRVSKNRNHIHVYSPKW